MTTSQDFCNWVCGPEIDPEFLMLAFMASQEHLRAIGSGAVHKTIYMPTIQTFHVVIPSLEEQRSLAKSLLAKMALANDLVERIATQLKDAEALPTRLLTSSLSDALRP